MKFYVRTILGSLMALCALAFFVFGIYQVARSGTCASGGAYVSTKQCAPGSTGWMFALPPALLIGLYGLRLVTLRGPRPGTAQPDPGPATYSLPRPAAPLDQAAFIEGLIANRSRIFTTTATPTADTDPIARIERLQSLLNAGALTPEEFQRAKAKILEEM